MSGFSLLEVLLALAILAGAIAVLGEANRNAVRNAQSARDLTVAQLLCESKMDEITSGIILPQAVAATTFETADGQVESGWLYLIETEVIDQERGLSAIRVTVAKDLPPQQRPAQFAITRWMGESSEQTSTETTTE